MNVKEIFPTRWLAPDDLCGRRFELVIASVQQERVHDRRTNQEVIKWSVAFQRAKKRLILNKTQAFAIARVAGSFETDNWPNCRVVLVAGIAHNGKPTINIEPATLTAGAGLDTSAAQGGESDPDVGLPDWSDPDDPDDPDDSE